MKRFALIGLADDTVTEIVTGVRDQDEPPADAEVIPHDPDAIEAAAAAEFGAFVSALKGDAGANAPAAGAAARKTETRKGVKLLPNGRPMVRLLIASPPDLAWWQVIAGESYEIDAESVTVRYQLGDVPLGQAQRRRKDEVDARLASRAEDGVALPGTGGKLVQLRQQDQPNVTAMALQAMLAKSGGAAWDPAFQWRMADNTFVTFATADTMLAFANAAASTVVATRRIAWGHKDAIDRLRSVADVAAYDINAGW